MRKAAHEPPPSLKANSQNLRLNAGTSIRSTISVPTNKGNRLVLPATYMRAGGTKTGCGGMCEACARARAPDWALLFIQHRVSCHARFSGGDLYIYTVALHIGCPSGRVNKRPKIFSRSSGIKTTYSESLFAGTFLDCPRQCRYWKRNRVLRIQGVYGGGKCSHGSVVIRWSWRDFERSAISYGRLAGQMVIHGR